MNARRQLALVATLFAASLTLPSCLVASDTQTESSGRFVSAETLGRVTVGESEDLVLSLLGEPTDKIDSSSGSQIWKWAYSSTTTKKGGVFLIAASSKTTSETGATYVEFQDGKVIKAWRD